MSSSLQKRIRQELRAAPDGLTAVELIRLMGKDSLANKGSTVYQALRRMPDVYIDRWTEYPVTAVYVAVEVPPNCPRPAFPKGEK